MGNDLQDDVDTKLATLKAQRSSTKGNLTRIKSYVNTNAATLSATDLECRLGILESYWKLLLSHQNAIELLKPSDSTNDSIRGELEDLYCSIKSKILSLMPSQRRSSVWDESCRTDLQDSNESIKNSTRPNLPKMTLPTFAGKYSEYPSYISKFNQLVDKQNISTTEKYSHLLNSLSGPALRTVEALGNSDSNYEKALEALKNRYDNNAIIFQEHITDLFELPVITKNSAEQLRYLIDKVNSHLNALKSLGNDENILNAFLVYIVKKKLDSTSQEYYYENIDHSKFQDWKNLAAIINKRCLILETKENKIDKPDSKFSSTNLKRSNFQQTSKSLNKTTLTTSKISSECSFCANNFHKIEKCPKFQALSVMDRYLFVKKQMLCIKCLRSGHTTKQCRYSNCKVCASIHHTLLHRYQSSLNSESSSNTQLSPSTNCSSSQASLPSSSSQNSQKSYHVSVKEIPSSYIFLATAIIKIKDKSGVFHMARALLDSASQINFMTDRLVHILKLKRIPITGNVEGIANVTSNIRFETETTIGSRLNSYTTSLQFWIMSSITGNQPSLDFEINNFKIPNNLELADPLFYKRQRIDLLIGASSFFELLSVGQIKLHENLPTLQKTVLGWVVSGRYNVNPAIIQMSNVAVESTKPNEDERLNKLVEKFWEIENVEKSHVNLTIEEQQCEESFMANINRDTNGSLVVKLHFKAPPTLLGNSFNIAKTRFLLLEKRLNRNLQNKIQYSNFLKEYLNLGHMEVASFDNIPECHYFMPHQYVLRPESSSTPLRVVFDASCRTSSNYSLNDILAVGPTVQKDLFSIILKFRCYQYALTADISKMYRQIFVKQEDRQFQYILWRENINEELQVFKLKTVTYGTASAPYLATRCLNHLADISNDMYPEAASIIKNSFYVDDLICGADDVQTLFKIKDEVSQILNSVNMNLCKWYSNNLEFLKQVPEEYREKPLRINDADIIKTLGMVWHPETDTFKFNYTNEKVTEKITKRTVLSELSRLFDPLGLINPIIVSGKIIMQELWILKLSWDESLPMQLHRRWSQFKESLPEVNNIEIPRYIMQQNSKNTIEIHGFCDASIRAYGCCIYIRCTDSSGNIKTSLISAKSRVAPSKQTRTLPVLELFGAELLAKLWFKVKENFTKPISNIYFWTDSNIVLGWLAAHASKWKTLVANRVSLIQELTENVTWNYVNTKQNPADVISRGSSIKELIASHWFTGPEFLQYGKEQWPKQSKELLQSLPEERTVNSKRICLIVKSSESLINYIYRWSNFAKLRRIFAYVTRFIENLKLSKLKKSHQTDSFTSTELDTSLLKIIYVIQQYEFETEFNQIRQNKLKQLNSSISCLNPFIEPETNLIRVGGRLYNSKLPYSTKCPILLPKNNNFIKSFINYKHIKYCHAGSQALMSIIRQNYWIINLRDYTRKIVRSCIHCFKYRPVLLQQVMGNLPADRLNSSLAFSTSGVDFCGPFLTTAGSRGRSHYKSYLAVFVCFISRGIHIEVVSDLTSNAFIAALKRFVSRRLLCKKLYCDNATNFVGARNSLLELKQRFLNINYQNDIQKWCAERSIQFCHIPPRSPHFGGIWEAAVKSAKTLLYPTLQQAILTFEELSTLCTQIESILNSRPITQMSNDPNDENALTPAHFWGQAPLECILEPNITNLKSSYYTKWQKISALQQYFWQRWSSEYITSLQKRYKWQTSSDNAIVGALVLIQEENLPPQKWLLGRITSVIKSTDNKVRVVDVKTKAGIIRRAIHKLARLPIDD